MTRRSSSTSEQLGAMLAVEAALVRAHAAAGTISADACTAIEAACAAGDWDADAIEAAGREHATPVVPLVSELRARVRAGAAPRSVAGAAAARDAEGLAAEDAAVHLGATSQDVVDSAVMLLAARARVEILADAARAAGAAAALADAHRATPVLGRTLMQAALPTSFGLKAAQWLRGIDAARTALAGVALPVQLGGPVGHGDPGLAAAVGADLGLDDPGLPWQADRTPVAALACALGTLAGALAKPARDVVLLAQTEVAEAREGGPGGRSSAMAHKRNPVHAIQVLAAAHRAPGLVATLLAGMAGEHERAAGAWQAERPALLALLDVTAEAAAHAATMLEGLEVDPTRMAANLRAAGLHTPAATASDRGASSVLIDRALRAHREVPS